MKKTIICGILTLAVSGILFSFDLPKGWSKAGSVPDKYDMGIDVGSGRNGKNAATIKSNTKKISGFGTLMQSCSPNKYLGKRVRMSGYMKSVDVDDWAGFWFRVDGPEEKKMLSFDNMHDRAVIGTTDWKKYEIVLDVPKNATNLAYGALLSKTGQIWFEGIEFEEVSDLMPQTGGWKLQEPQNLNFEK